MEGRRRSLSDSDVGTLGDIATWPIDRTERAATTAAVDDAIAVQEARLRALLAKKHEFSGGAYSCSACNFDQAFALKSLKMSLDEGRWLVRFQTVESDAGVCGFSHLTCRGARPRAGRRARGHVRQPTLRRVWAFGLPACCGSSAGKRGQLCQWCRRRRRCDARACGGASGAPLNGRC